MSLAAYSSVRLLPSLSRYLAPSMYGTKSSSMLASSIWLTAAPPAPPPPAPPGPPLPGNDALVGLTSCDAEADPVDEGRSDEVPERAEADAEAEVVRKNSCALRSSTSEAVWARARCRMRR